MHKRENKYFRCFLAIIIGLFLLLPLTQSSLNILNIPPLIGDTTVFVFQKPKVNTYTNSEWQEETTTYINRTFGFRPLLVRIFNQLKYSLFSKSDAAGVVVAKNGDLIIESYIDEYIGKNFLGTSVINSNVTKIKQVQDSLKSRGIDLIVVFAPGKASFEPELIPDSYISNKKDSTNYGLYRELFSVNKINFLDLNAYFSNNRKFFEHKVFPRYGAHWNHYGMCIGLDTLLRYIENLQKKNLADFDFSDIEYSKDLKNNDFDIGILMNTLIPIEKDSNPYPKYKIQKDNKTELLDVLVVGDSYWWCITGENLPSKFFKNDEYWFYNQQQLVNNTKKAKTKELNFFESVRSRDVIVIISCEATYHLFPFGFIDKAHTFFCENHNKELDNIIKNIYSNTEWYSSIIKKANLNNVPIEKQVKLDAEFVLSNELFNPKLSLDSIITTIKLNKEWMKDIEIKSKNNNKTIQEQLEMDAQWYFENQKTK